jgi:NADP-dependent 3-hydroxy acid dehydrogenase YdfG
MGEALRGELRQIHENDGIRVTVVEPGMVDTPFFEDGAADWALADDDIARVVLYALNEPPGVDINEILVRPARQSG